MTLEVQSANAFTLSDSIIGPMLLRQLHGHDWLRRRQPGDALAHPALASLEHLAEPNRQHHHRQ